MFTVWREMPKPWTRVEPPPWRSARPQDPSLVPDRAVGLVDAAVRAVDQEPVEAAGEPPVVRHRDHRALEGLQAGLERLGALDVEVVGRLVEQQQRRAGQLEQQDLEPRLLAPAERLELLLSRVGELVAVEHAGGLLAPHPVTVVVAAVEDLQQGPAHQLGVLVGLHEPPWPDPRPQLGAAGVVHRRDRDLTDRQVLAVGVAAAGGQQPQEVGLPGPVAAEDGHPLAVPDLEVEGTHQAGQLELFTDHRALAGPASLEAHLHLLLAWLLGRRTRLLELPQPGLRRLVAAGHVGVVGSLLLQLSIWARSLACSSSQRFRSSSNRRNRCLRASW